MQFGEAQGQERVSRHLDTCLFLLHHPLADLGERYADSQETVLHCCGSWQRLAPGLLDEESRQPVCVFLLRQLLQAWQERGLGVNATVRPARRLHLGWCKLTVGLKRLG